MATGQNAAQTASSKLQWFRFRFNKEEDTRKESRNVLLVVATLIAAVTFQAGVNPPGGVWQQDDDGHKAGRAIYADQTVPFYVFLISNTTALSTSIHIIISLTYKFPFNIELWAATVALFLTYASAVFAILPDPDHFDIKKRFILTAAALPTVLQVLKKLYRTMQLSQVKPGN